MSSFRVILGDETLVKSATSGNKKRRKVMFIGYLPYVLNVHYHNLLKCISLLWIMEKTETSERVSNLSMITESKQWSQALNQALHTKACAHSLLRSSPAAQMPSPLHHELLVSRSRVLYTCTSEYVTLLTEQSGAFDNFFYWNETEHQARS